MIKVEVLKKMLCFLRVEGKPGRKLYQHWAQARSDQIKNLKKARYRLFRIVEFLGMGNEPADLGAKPELASDGILPTEYRRGCRIAAAVWRGKIHLANGRKPSRSFRYEYFRVSNE
jgi:hypothetical protein